MGNCSDIVKGWYNSVRPGAECRLQDNNEQNEVYPQPRIEEHFARWWKGPF